MKPLEWKSKRSDVIVVLVIFLLTVVLFHVFISLSGSRHDRTDSVAKFLEHLASPGMFCFAVLGASIAYSPLVAFRFKVPKRITIDLEQGLLIIQRRKKKKEQLIALDGIGYVHYDRGIFSVLEIYHTFETSRRGSFRKRFRTIMVPFWGMALNRRDLKEIVKRLKEHGGTEERLIQKRSFEDLMSD